MTNSHISTMQAGDINGSLVVKDVLSLLHGLGEIESRLGNEDILMRGILKSISSAL